MAMNLGYKTTKLYFNNGSVSISSDIRLSNTQIFDSWGTDGTWGGGAITGGKNGATLSESDYLDLGIVTDEREECTIGGIPLSLPFTSSSARLYWAIGGKITRVTLSGVIPDGNYVSIDDPDTYSLNTKSNISVFVFKINKFFSYLSISDGLLPHTVHYRRKYLTEVPDSVSGPRTARWVMTGYSMRKRSERILEYSLTLDLANNIDIGLDLIGGGNLKSGIAARAFGDIE